MLIFVLKTSIKNQIELDLISPFLENHPKVLRWTIDLKDSDRVLRIEANEGASIYEIAAVIRKRGFECSELEG